MHRFPERLTYPPFVFGRNPGVPGDTPTVPRTALYSAVTARRPSSATVPAAVSLLSTFMNRIVESLPASGGLMSLWRYGGTIKIHIIDKLWYQFTNRCLCTSTSTEMALGMSSLRAR